MPDSNATPSTRSGYCFPKLAAETLPLLNPTRKTGSSLRLRTWWITALIAFRCSSDWRYLNEIFRLNGFGNINTFAPRSASAARSRITKFREVRFPFHPPPPLKTIKFSFGLSDSIKLTGSVPTPLIVIQEPCATTLCPINNPRPARTKLKLLGQKRRAFRSRTLSTDPKSLKARNLVETDRRYLQK